MIGWDKICQPKKFGGLGIRKAKINNVALQFKLLWKIFTAPDNLWLKLVKQKYLKGADLFSYKLKANVSWQWHKLMSLRSSLKKGLRWESGSGQAVSFWFDHWGYDVPLAEVCVVQEGTEGDAVCRFISQDRQWKLEALAELLPDDVVQDIKNVFLPRNPMQDSLFWSLSPDGVYSVKPGVSLLQGLGSQERGHSVFGYGNLMSLRK